MSVSQRSTGGAVPGTSVPASSLVTPGGAQGVAGPTSVSSDAGNLATFGTDNKIYVPGALATSTAKGLVGPLSGNVGDYLGGDNQCHSLITPTADYYDHDDFTCLPYTTPATGGNSKLFYVQASPGGAGFLCGCYNNFLPGHPGILQLAPGTTASSYARAYMPGMIAIDASLTITIQGVIAITTGSFAGNNQYFFGLANSPGPVITVSNNYVGFYANAGAGPNWYAYTRATSNVQSKDTGIAVGSTTTWHKFKLVITPSLVSFYIDDVLVMTTNDTSIPGNSATFVTFFTNNGTGTNNFSLFVDCFDIWLQLAGPSRFMRTNH